VLLILEFATYTAEKGRDVARSLEALGLAQRQHELQRP
jgi:hypothetical protein